MVKLMLGFCKMSQSDIRMVETKTGAASGQGEDLEKEMNDVNAFLISFLESDEDQLNCVSIRLSVIEFID